MIPNARRTAAIAAGLVLAAAQPAAADTLPQLDTLTYTPQLVWLAIIFAAMMLLMWRVALPRISSLLEERRERVDGDLDKAAKMKAEAEEIMAAYEKRLAEARAEAHGLQRETADAIAAASTKAQDELTRELAAQTRDAEARIAAAKHEALTHVREVAVDVGDAMVAKLIGETDRTRVESAVNAAMGDQGR